MFTELIDSLRCPNPHEDSWLVATSTRTGQRHILDGKLGCPVCHATFPIEDGEVMFSAGSAMRSAIVLDQDSAFRLAAQLHLLEAPQPILLTGIWSRAVPALRALVPTVTMFVGNATTMPALDEKVSAIRLPSTGIPLASGVLRGLALDALHAAPAFLVSAARVVRASGRLVVPAATALDDESWRIVASDDAVIVAERRAVASAPVQLKRAPASPLFDV